MATRNRLRQFIESEAASALPLLVAAIAAGRLPDGARLPSIRQLCADHGISPATAFQTYATLEARGLVEVRPRSGYYVRTRQASRPLPPPVARPRPGAARPATST